MPKGNDMTLDLQKRKKPDLERTTREEASTASIRQPQSSPVPTDIGKGRRRRSAYGDIYLKEWPAAAKSSDMPPPTSPLAPPDISVRGWEGPKIWRVKEEISSATANICATSSKSIWTVHSYSRDKIGTQR
jgi:hypothetical protein